MRGLSLLLFLNHTSPQWVRRHFTGNCYWGRLFLLDVPSPHPLPAEFFAGLFLHLTVGGKFFLVGNAIRTLNLKFTQFLQDRCGVKSVIVLFSEVYENVGEVDVLFLHLLMMASALFGLPRTNKYLHCLENLIGSSHVTVDEVLVVNFQEPVILLVFFRHPMSMVQLLWLLFLAPSPPHPLLQEVSSSTGPALG